jgi:hypothetical protein
MTYCLSLTVFHLLSFTYCLSLTVLGGARGSGFNLSPVLWLLDGLNLESIFAESGQLHDNSEGKRHDRIRRDTDALVRG